jgi:hypothetical protein
MTAVQAVTGLRALNAMMRAWPTIGIAYAHTDVGLDDAYGPDDMWQEATTMLLAERLARSYGLPPVDAIGDLRALQAGFMVIGTVEMPTAVLRTSSQKRGRWFY